ncbi:MAG: thioredoxin fold domain-containing protein [Betaproteobacteria bacterium]
MKIRIATLWLLWALAGVAPAQEASPHAIDVPSWFAQTFLDFREDIVDAAREKKRLLVYFGQDGCPYCRMLMTNNFSQRAIVDKTRRHFVAIELNIWGARETTWMDGRTRSEKDLARFLDVQFTPTVLLLDESGKAVVRMDGYWPPHRFEGALDYAAQHREAKEALGAYLGRSAKAPASAKLHDEPFFMPPPYDLKRAPGAKPLAVVFETTGCAACDELHRDGFRRAEVAAEVRRFDVARFGLGAATPLTTPDGRATTAAAWARELGVVYTPTIVLFDAKGAEAFRVAGYVRAFHLSGSFAYVADGGYRDEPSFQTWLQARADRMRARGERVELLE